MYDRVSWAKTYMKFAGLIEQTGRGLIKITKKGIFITTSDFTSDGKKWIKDLKDTIIILINGKQLAKLMVEYDVGVSTINNIQIKRIDQDYFEQFL